jgi:hypothetical protein
VLLLCFEVAFFVKDDQTRIMARIDLMLAAANTTTICSANRGCSDTAQ